MALNKLTPNEGESAEAYKHRFIRVFDELYPGQPTKTDVRDPRMVDRFLETIKDKDLCFHLGTKDPVTVDQCCRGLWGSYFHSRAKLPTTRQSLVHRLPY